ncbi:MAG: thiamine phosphate synthase [Gemmatimonadetes bacterium]|nr:thiamine phosphate synthase [Gemmatimonadota bacterium]|tara:strand:- start:37757 stop:38404 length:648 start_codon:yes stop_codon:yes gene_type:complete
MANRSLPELLRLIVITDPILSKPFGLINTIEATLEAGAGMIQLRDKHANSNELLESAMRILVLTRATGALLVVNDRLDVALAANADGVHLGPDDARVSQVRNIVPENFIIGYSTDDPSEGKEAESQGADYLGCGTVYRTSNKPDAGSAIGPDGIKKMVDAVSIPVVGIGGITPQNTTEIWNAGASGVAVIGAIMDSSDPGNQTKEFLRTYTDRSE